MPNLPGVYRGTVLNAADPMKRQRLQVSCPTAGLPMAWAMSSVPPGNNFGQAYRVGDTVWVAFEGGDLQFPVVLGRSP